MAQLQQTAITGTLTTTGNLTVTGSITNTGNITTAGDLTVNGSTVIDTSVDGALAALRVTQRGTGPSLLVEDQANPDSTRFVVDNAGNVSIGTNTVATKLNIAGDITLFTGNQIYASTGSATRPAYSFIAVESNTGFFRPSADTIAISTDGVERVRVTSTGNVGIGTSSPNSKLDINGDTIVTGSITNTGNITTAGHLAVSGSAVIDTSVPYDQAALRVTQRGTGPSLIVEDQANPDSSRFVIDNAGNVSIGGGDLAVNGGDITSNASTLFISGSQQVRLQKGIFITDDGLLVSGGLGAGITIDRALGATGNPFASSLLFIGSPTGEEALITTNSTKFNIISFDRDLNIETSDGSTSRPAVNQRQKTYEIGIGRSAVFGTSIIASGSEIVLETSTVSMPSGNISFESGFGIDFSNGQATGMTSELFNDYEEGTWTPSFSGSTGAGNYSYGALTGRYTKIGNIVYISGYVDISSIIANATGNMRIAGLPFNVNNTPNGNQFFMSVAWENFTTAATNVFAAAADNGSWIDLYIQTSTTSTNALAIALSPTNLGIGGIRFTGFYRVA